MTLNMREYHHLAMRTSPRDGHDKMENGILGLIGETGELVDLFKKFAFQSTPDAQLPSIRMAEELGDVLWYMVELADGMGMELCDICTSFALWDERAQQPHVRPSLRNTVVRLARQASILSREVERGDKYKIHQEMRHLIRLAARLGRIIGRPLTQIAWQNIEKLKARYPEGFSAEISMARYEQ